MAYFWVFLAAFAILVNGQRIFSRKHDKQPCNDLEDEQIRGTTNLAEHSVGGGVSFNGAEHGAGVAFNVGHGSEGGVSFNAGHEAEDGISLNAAPSGGGVSFNVGQEARGGVPFSVGHGTGGGVSLEGGLSGGHKFAGKLLLPGRHSFGGSLSLEGGLPTVAGSILPPHHPPQTAQKHFRLEGHAGSLLPVAPVDKVKDRVSLEKLLEEEWSAFKLTYNKAYNSLEEENLRKEIFLENRHKIAIFNQEYGLGKYTFVQQLNNFADMLLHEFNRNFNGFNRTTKHAKYQTSQGSHFISPGNVPIPESVDWREVGAVSPVKSQQLCAGCWAFAAAGALEGHTYRKTGQLNDLSPQNLIDCTEDYGNDGCEGGLITPAFEYVKNNPGIDTEASYPFEAKNGPCRFTQEGVGAYCSGFVEISEGDEKALEAAVATLGPVAVAIDASRDAFQFYSDGVYFDPTCGNTLDDMNHAVLIVGYGQETDGQKYWLVKNSYGTTWGVGGYVKMAKEAGNHCGIANMASYPLV